MAYGTSFERTAAEIEDEKILLEAKKRFKYCEQWEAQARDYFDYDIKFANADANNMYQWDSWVVGDRIDTGRPCLTINKTQQHNLQIINDAKQNKPGVNIRPVGDTASFEAAQVFQEVVRHIEYISNAENVYDNGTTFQVEGGIGYWRLITDYVSDKSRDQEIYIRRIKNPKSVYLDPDIDEVDGSDANYGFIFTDKIKEVYEAENPDFKNVGGQSVLGNTSDGWFTKTHIRIAEYYTKILKDDRYIYFMLPETGEEIEGYWSELPKEAHDKFKEIKAREDNLPPSEQTFWEKDVVRSDIKWYKIAGDRIIKRGVWLGKYIPIVRVVGTETVIDGVLDRKGHTRALLDPQRIYNVNSPLALDTPLPTPTGWTTMGEVAQGDWLFDEKGQPVEVAGISPVFINRDCYKIEFDDSTYIIADANHLWTTEEREKIKTYNWTWPVKTVTTKELVPNKHFIYATKPIDLEEKDLLIHPYVLGAWLGDGTSASAQFTCGSADLENIQSNIISCGYDVALAREMKHGAFNFTVHDLRWRLSAKALLQNKRIPKEYLRASKEQRLDLLRGLMDTDGCYSKSNNRCIFTNTDMQLIEDFIELIRSLGLRFVRQDVAVSSRMFPNGKTYECVPASHISFTVDPEIAVFKLNRKLEPQTKHRVVHERRSKRHRILSVTKIASVPVKCVCINSESHLFLAGKGMIPTHNSANVEFGALQSKSPIMAPADAVEGHEEYYKTSNTVNHAWIPYNHMGEDGNPIPPPQRMQAPQSSPAYVEQMKIAQSEMMMVSGQYQAQLGENENAKSGIAINARQRQGDRATYHFIDNLAIAVRYTGKQLIDLIPKIYDTKRIIRIEAKDGSVMDVTIDPKATQAYQKLPPPDDQQTDNTAIIHQIIFNPNIGTYDIQSDTGPSYATRRQEAFNALTQIAAQNKEFMNVAGDILWKVADFPEAQVLAQRWRRIIPPQVLGDAPNPQTEELMHKASDQIEMLQGQLAAMVKKVEDREREFAIKEREVMIREQQFMHDKQVDAVSEIREDYKALSARITALGNSGPAISMEQITPLVKQAVIESLQGGLPTDNDLPGIHEGGTPIVPPTEPATDATAG